MAKSDGGGLSTVLRWDKLADGTGQDTTCDTPGRYSLRITRDNKGTDRVPVELLVRVEPPVTGGKGDPTQAARVEFAGRPSGAGKAVRGGGSFNEATTLAGPGRYAETVFYGEQLYYRVKLDWGQGLAYRVTYGGVPDGQTVNVRTALFNPVRDEIDTDTAAYTGETKTLPTNGKPIATSRVMYLNRDSDDTDIPKMAVDGWYYLVVKLGSADAAASGVPIKIDLAVAGTKVDGPEYSTVGSTPEPTPTGTPEPSASSTPTDSGNTASTPVEAGGPIEGTATEKDSASTLPWVIGGAAALLAVAGVGIALILRTRRPSGPTWPH
jgi:Ca-activated chloride channel family protein